MVSLRVHLYFLLAVPGCGARTGLGDPGADGVDCDGDGFPSLIVHGTDCDDSAPEVHPGAQVPAAPAGWSIEYPFASHEAGGASSGVVADGSSLGIFFGAGRDTRGVTWLEQRACSWHQELVDEEGQGPVSVGRGADGAFVVTFRESSTDDDRRELRVARRSEEGWSSMAVSGVAWVVESEFATGGAGDIVVFLGSVEPSGPDALHIALPSAAGQWAVAETIDSSEDAFLPSVSSDAEGRIHIAFIKTSDPRPMAHAVGLPGSWALDLASREGAGAGTSLSTGPANVVSIAFTSEVGNDVVLVSDRTGAWAQELVDSRNVNGPLDLALAVDPWGRPHIAYYDLNRRELRYASRAARRYLEHGDRRHPAQRL